MMKYLLLLTIPFCLNVSLAQEDEFDLLKELESEEMSSTSNESESISDEPNELESLESNDSIASESNKADDKSKNQKIDNELEELENLDEQQTEELAEIDDTDGDLANNPSEEAEIAELEGLSITDKEELDDFRSLEAEISDSFEDESYKEKELQALGENLNEEILPILPLEDEATKRLVNADDKSASKKIVIYDVGDEEKYLLEQAQFIQGKIDESEWEEILANGKNETYTIQSGDYLWKIAQKLFGSGFYYAKIWSLNPYITNPHQIETGQILEFNSGDSLNPPEIQLGSFITEEAKQRSPEETSSLARKMKNIDYSYFGEDVEPPWIKEKRILKRNGVFIQTISENDYTDLFFSTQKSFNREYEKYEPPIANINLSLAQNRTLYDESGFDNSSKVRYNIQDGISVNTFVSTNYIHDVGLIEAGQKENITFDLFDEIFIRFDTSANISPGDKFSIYQVQGEVEHKLSERSGFKYSITGQVEVVRKVNSLWQVKIIKAFNEIKRGDRLTLYTPSLSQLIKTYNDRKIEAVIVGAYDEDIVSFSEGNIIYLDRGRADGVEIGNVFDIYSFTDPNTDKKITPDPSYKIGDVTIVSLTDNFATGLILSSRSVIKTGQLTITKSKSEYLNEKRLKNRLSFKNVKKKESVALKELDVEMDLDELNEDLLKQADNIQLNEEELNELEKLERQNSVIADSERDVFELERLEKEIETAEAQVNEAKRDQDRYLENENLDDIEKTLKSKSSNAYASMNDIEDEFGKKYMDEDVNAKENPYGLTEYDIEEIDELLNIDD